MAVANTEHAVTGLDARVDGDELAAPGLSGDLVLAGALQSVHEQEGIGDGVAHR